MFLQGLIVCFGVICLVFCRKNRFLEPLTKSNYQLDKRGLRVFMESNDEFFMLVFELRASKDYSKLKIFYLDFEILSKRSSESPTNEFSCFN